ncbi:MAG TPA: NADH:flavin oxidoreductase/NADH oxidase [Ramlibacter sp.]|nr:NADH:flavin oxidoreductase/NADH oxidase [Ramlibacter sp.]
MSLLFSPFQLRGVTFANRIALSPMCQYSAVDGVAGAWHLAHYGARMIGGAGLVMLESTAVSAAGRITPGCLGLWNDAQEEALRALVAQGHALGVRMGVQLNHAGRKGSVQVPWHGGQALAAEHGAWPVPAPSAEHQGAGLSLPYAMGEQDIRAVVGEFASAAARAVRCGFDVVELHAAHGYLLHQFLSPLSNHRQDAHGGDFAGRTRFTREALAAMRAVLPDSMPLFVRLSCTDGAPGGWTLDESVRLAQELRAGGADLIDCTSGGIAAAQPRPAGVAFNAEAAQRVATEAAISTATVGGIADASQAEQVLARGQADLLFLGRALLADPFWPLRARRALGAAETPPQYQRATF